jgi:hypothetical protein
MESRDIKDFGNGAIADTEDAMKLKSLRAAIGLAEAGLKSDDLDTAKKVGAQAAAEIKKAEWMNLRRVIKAPPRVACRPERLSRRPPPRCSYPNAAIRCFQLLFNPAAVRPTSAPAVGHSPQAAPPEAVIIAVSISEKLSRAVWPRGVKR